MKRPGIVLLLVLFLFKASYAQEPADLKGGFYLAPDFGLMLGSINNIELSPAIGYHLSERFSLAAGFKYEFYSQTRLYAYQPAFKTHIYGPRAFARYTLFKNLGDFLPIGMNTALFAHVEFESSSLENKYFHPTNFTQEGRFWYSTALVGGGFSQDASERIKINVLLLWDTDGGYTSLYNNPILRFGFQFFLRPRSMDSF